jgi:hypothetical protein
MPTIEECIARAERYEQMVNFAVSDAAKETYLAAAASWRRLAAIPELPPAETDPGDFSRSAR